MIGANLFAEFTLPNEFVYSMGGNRFVPTAYFTTQSGKSLAQGSVEEGHYQLANNKNEVIAKLDYHPFTYHLSSKCSLFVVRDEQENILGSFTFVDGFAGMSGTIFDEGGSRVGSISHNFWNLTLSVDSRDSEDQLVIAVELQSSVLKFIGNWLFKGTVFEHRPLEEATVDPRVIAAAIQIHANPKATRYTSVDKGEPLAEADLANLATQR